jgi:hypothetical protein
MKYLAYSLVVLSLLISGLYAQSKITLDTPVQVEAGASEFTLNSFSFDQAGKRITIGFLEVNGDRSLTFSYSGDDFDVAFGLFVNASLENKIITQLQTDGKLGPGVISP